MSEQEAKQIVLAKYPSACISEINQIWPKMAVLYYIVDCDTYIAKNHKSEKSAWSSVATYILNEQNKSICNTNSEE